MNARRYLPGELYGIETAYRRGYVATMRFDDDLATDWYEVCCEEGLPFVQCAYRRKYHQIDYDLKPFLDSRPDLGGLTDEALSRLEEIAAAACKASPSHLAKHQLTDVSGLIVSIPRDDAHALARRIAGMLRNLGNYRRQTP